MLNETKVTLTSELETPTNTPAKAPLLDTDATQGGAGVVKVATSLSREQKNLLYQEALKVSNQLEETNIQGVFLLAKIFGLEAIQTRAEEALQLWEEARRENEKSGNIYQPSERGTPVATKPGQPRTKGGVFYFLMRQVVDEAGMKWEELGGALNRFPKKKANPNTQPAYSPPQSTEAQSQCEHNQSAVVAAKPGVERANDNSVSRTIPPTVIELPLPPAVSTVGEGTSGVGGISVAPIPGVSSAISSNAKKPTRTKVTVIGILVAAPKVVNTSANQQQQQSGGVQLMELALVSTMNDSLPKGLPNLGQTLVKVWATTKQIEKFRNEMLSGARLLIEGEPVAGVSRDLKPFMRVVCTRITTVEAEQTRQAATKNDTPNSSGSSSGGVPLTPETTKRRWLL